MNLLEKIQLLAAQQNTTLAALDRDCKFAHGTIRRLGTVVPSIDKVCAVALRLHVSIDYLCGLTSSPAETSFVPVIKNSFEVSDDEKKMVVSYRHLSATRQANVLNYLNDQYKLNKSETKKDKNVG